MAQSGMTGGFFPWQDLPSLDDLVACRPKLWTQVTIILAHFVLWSVWIPAATAVLETRIPRQPWGHAMVTRFEQANRKVGVLYPDFQSSLRACARMIALIPQHMLGGLLCVPAVYPGVAVALGVSPVRAVSLAMHGALCEAGWEVQDTVMRAWELAFSPRGRDLNPPVVLFFSGMHHLMGLSMVLPMNLWHGAHPEYHELILLLQAAAATALSINFYVITLDISCKSQLRQMQVLSTAAFLLFGYTRGYRFLFICAELLRAIHAEAGGGAVFLAAVTAVLGMFITNAVILYDSFGRFAKFVLGVRLSKATGGGVQRSKVE